MKSNLCNKAAILCAAFSFSVVASATEDPNSSMIISQLNTDGVTWSTAGAPEFKPFIGDNFSVVMADGQSFDLKLSEVIAGAEDPDRPAFLPRKHSVVLVLNVSASDQARMSELGSQSANLMHHGLGQGQAFVQPVSDKSGNYTVELSLN